MNGFDTDSIVTIVILLGFLVLFFVIVTVRQSLKYVYLISYSKKRFINDSQSYTEFEYIIKSEFITLPHRIREEDIRQFRASRGGISADYCQIIAITKILIKFQRDAH